MFDLEVHVERHANGVAVVTIDRPGSRNALGWETWRQLLVALEESEADDAVRVVVLTGAGGCFSAGGDMKSSPAAGEDVFAPSARLRLGHRVVRVLYHLPKPTVAAVEGFALGAGWSLALAADVVVAADDAFFAAPFVQRGLVPDAGAAWFLARRAGHHVAADIIFTGQRVPAPRAAEAGLVSRLVPPRQALPQATELAAVLAAGPADALGLAKRLLRHAADADLGRFLDTELLSAALNSYGPDAVEGRAAFVEKREPRFRSGPAR